MIDVYESAVDHTGRYGAVFERDDDTAFFYLLDLARGDDSRIIEAFNAHTVRDLPADAPVAIHWAASGHVVGLYVGGGLVALFDVCRDDGRGRWATGEDGGLFVRH